MNKATADIAKYLNISITMALVIQEEMEKDGLDFSECSQRAFNKAAREAAKKVMLPDELPLVCSK